MTTLGYNTAVVKKMYLASKALGSAVQFNTAKIHYSIIAGWIYNVNKNLNPYHTTDTQWAIMFEQITGIRHHTICMIDTPYHYKMNECYAMQPLTYTIQILATIQSAIPHVTKTTNDNQNWITQLVNVKQVQESATNMSSLQPTHWNW